MQEDVDAVRDDYSAKCVAALTKVPHDGPDASGGDLSRFSDRLKRMELSALNQTPLQQPP